MSRLVIAAGCAGLLFLGDRQTVPTSPGAPRPAAAHVSAPAVTYAAPLSASVVIVHPFVAPVGPYAAGHRGTDLASSAGSTVLAAAGGLVRFAGVVVDRGVVVIEHPDGVLTEYEPVSPEVAAGDRVERGDPIGLIRGVHGGCSPGGCLHWGARRGGAYFDPMTLLAALGPVRLLPWADRS